jgi:hypothetical protein
MAIIRWIGTWALLSAFAIGFAYLFIWGWDRQSTLAEKPPWSKPSSMERELQPFQLDFANGPRKSTGHGYYDRRKERGR